MDRLNNIYATDFGSEPYFLVSPTNNSPHFLSPNEKGRKHQPREMLKLTSSYLYAESYSDRLVGSSSFAQHVRESLKSKTMDRLVLYRPSVVDDLLFGIT